DALWRTAEERGRDLRARSDGEAAHAGRQGIRVPALRADDSPGGDVRDYRPDERYRKGISTVRGTGAEVEWRRIEVHRTWKFRAGGADERACIGFRFLSSFFSLLVSSCVFLRPFFFSC